MKQLINFFGVMSLGVIVMFVGAFLPIVAKKGFKALTPFGRYVFGTSAVLFLASAVLSLLVGCALYNTSPEVEQLEQALDRDLCVGKCWELHPGDAPGALLCVDDMCEPPTRTQCRNECKDLCLNRLDIPYEGVPACFEDCEDDCPPDLRPPTVYPGGSSLRRVRL